MGDQLLDHVLPALIGREMEGRPLVQSLNVDVCHQVQQVLLVQQLLHIGETPVLCCRQEVLVILALVLPPLGPCPVGLLRLGRGVHGKVVLGVILGVLGEAGRCLVGNLGEVRFIADIVDLAGVLVEYEELLLFVVHLPHVDLLEETLLVILKHLDYLGVVDEGRGLVHASHAGELDGLARVGIVQGGSLVQREIVVVAYLVIRIELVHTFLLLFV